LIGVKRGDIGQYVKMLHAAAYANIRGRVERIPANEFEAGVKKAKEGNYSAQIVLQY
jgi:hypothetical protein